MMRAQTDDPAEIDAINHREVGAHLAEAAASAGMAKQWHLQEAIKIARDRGLTDLVREATAALQAIPVKDLGLKRSIPLSASREITSSVSPAPSPSVRNGVTG
jgi:hypothetical protein